MFLCIFRTAPVFFALSQVPVPLVSQIRQKNESSSSGNAVCIYWSWFLASICSESIDLRRAKLVTEFDCSFNCWGLHSNSCEDPITCQWRGNECHRHITGLLNSDRRKNLLLPMTFTGFGTIFCNLCYFIWIVDNWCHGCRFFLAAAEYL